MLSTLRTSYRVDVSCVQTPDVLISNKFLSLEKMSYYSRETDMLHRQ